MYIATSEVSEVASSTSNFCRLSRNGTVTAITRLPRGSARRAKANHTGSLKEEASVVFV